MSFSDNLRILRKKKGLSQEQLAMQLDVSRQAVSKWESNSNSYPEMEMLIKLSVLFECSMDDLLKGDLSDVDLDGKKDCDHHYQLIAKAYTFAIMSILFGVCLYLLLEHYFPENTKYEFVGQIVFMIFVLIGIVTFVYFGIQASHFDDEKYKALALYNETEINQFHQKYSLSVACGVGLIMFSLVMQLIIDNLYSEDLANLVFMVLVTLAVGDFVYFGVLKGKYDLPQKANVKEGNRASLLCGVVMLITSAIYLLWSFLGHSWEISWLVYPIGGIACGIVWLLATMDKK